MFSKKWQRRSALFLFIVYSLDLGWKLANWDETFGLVPWWGLALGLAFRFGFMGFVLFLYLRLRKSVDESQPVDVKARSACVRSVRIIHRIFLVVIVMYIFLTEWLFKSETSTSGAFVISFYVMAIAMTAIFYAIRQKLLRAASAAMERNPADAEALGRWRAGNILGMIGAVSISMFGLALRAIGGSRPMVWPFFVAAMMLMFILRPQDPALAPSGIEGSNQ
jgi:hypothetical protein